MSIAPRARAAVCGANTFAVAPTSFTTIQAAVNALPGTLPADFCINVDTSPHSEQVTVTNNTAGHRLFIQLDPGIYAVNPSTRTPINPPTNSTAAFQVMAASVSIIGFNIISTNTVAYGILASAAQVQVSSVNVIDLGGRIWTAGIALSSGSYLSYSSITVQNAYGVQLLSKANAISQSTIASNGGSGALYIQDSSNTITGSYISNPAGIAAYFGSSNSNGNTISQSTITSGTSFALMLAYGVANTISQSYLSSQSNHGVVISANFNTIMDSTITSNGNGSAALDIQNGSANTITRSYLSNQNGSGGYGAWLWGTGNSNSISQSTITSRGPNFYALYVQNASDTLSGLYVQGPTAVYISGSTGTVIGASVLVATNTAGMGLWLGGGSINLTLSSSIVTGVSQGAGVYLDLNNMGAITLSSNIITGARYGLAIATQGIVGQAFTGLAISSLTFPSLAPGATAINFLGGQFVSTFAAVNFADSNMAVNVNARALSAGSRITILQSTGTKAGPAFEQDTHGYVDWPGFYGNTLTPLSLVALSSASVQASWNSTFAPGTYYYAVLSTETMPNNDIGNSWSGTTQLSSATWNALAPNTTYYAGVSTTAFWQSMVPFSSPVMTPPGNTLTLGTLVTVSSSSVKAFWNTTYAPGTTYYAVASTGPLPNNYDNPVVTTQGSSATWNSLTPNTPYYAGVSTMPSLVPLSTFTYSVQTMPGNTLTPLSLVALSSASVKASWNSTFAPETYYYAVLSTETMPNNDIGNYWSGTTQLSSATWGGLAPNTTYYAGVSTTAFWQVMIPFGVPVMTPPGNTLAPLSFVAVTSNSMTGRWASTFAPGTAYYAVLSTGNLPNNYPSNVTLSTTGTSVTWTGLSPLTSYFAAVSTSASEIPFTSLGSANTLPAPHLVFTTLPQTLSAGACSPPVTLQSRDMYESPLNLIAAATITLTATSGTLGFYANAGCDLSVTSVTIGAGGNSATFYLRDVTAGSSVIKASSTWLTPAAQAVTVSGGSLPSKLFILTSSQTLSAGVCSSSVTVQSQDSYNNPVNVSAALTVNLGGALTFYGDPACGNSLAAISIAAGGNSTSLYFKGTAAGTPSLTASASGLSQASQVEAITGGSPTQLAFTTLPQTVSAGACSSSVTIQSLDAFGNPVSVVASTSVSLSVSSSATLGFYSDAACAVSTTSVTIGAGTKWAVFYFEDLTAGATPVITASATWLTPATQGEVISGANQPAKLVFLSPPRTAAAGVCSSSVTVQSRDSLGIPRNVTADTMVTWAAASLTLGFYSDAACAATLANAWIPANASTTTVYFKDTTVGVSTITATAAALTPATQSETITGSAPTQLVFTTLPQTVSAGACSSSVTVQSRDAFGNPANVVAAATVTLTATSGNLGFYADASCTASIASATIAAATNWATFYFKDIIGEVPTVIAKANGLSSASQGEVVNSGGATQLVFTTPPQTLSVGKCSLATVQSRDSFNNPVNVSAATTVNWSSDSGTLGFYSDYACATAVNSMSIPAAMNQASVYFRDSSSGTPNISALATGLASARQAETIIGSSGGTPIRLAIITSSQTLSAGTCSGLVTVQAQDSAGNPANVAVATTVYLTATSASLQFYSDSNCTARLSALSIPAAMNLANFYFMDTAGGSPVLTAAVSGLSAANQTEAISGGVFALTIVRVGSGLGRVVSSPAGIDCGNGGTSCSFNFNGAVTLTAVIGSGSDFGGWSGGGCGGSTAPTCALNMTVAQNVTVGFIASGLALTVTNAGTGSGNVASYPSGINCGLGGASCSASYSSGTSVTLTAAPGGGSLFAGWSGAGCSGTGNCSVTLSAAQSVTAIFAPSGFSLTVSTTGGGSGSVSSSVGGINCGLGGGICSASLSSSTVVTLTATPGSGSVFSGWSGGGCSDAGSCIVTMGAAQSVSAKFSPSSGGIVLTVGNPGTSGSIYSYPAGINCGLGMTGCSTAFPMSMVVTLTAAAGQGFAFAGWSGAGCTGTGSCTVTLNAAQNVTAGFNSIGYSLTVTTVAAAGGGTIYSNPTGINCGPGATACVAAFPSGTAVTLSATAGANSVFAGWSGGGCSGTGSCAVTISTAQNIVATFNAAIGGFPLVVNVGGSGQGNVYSPAGINCGLGGTVCSTAFAAQKAVTLTAVPAAGSVFAGWGGGCTGTGSCTVMMSVAQNITATFTTPYTLTVSNPSLATGTVVSVPPGINCGSGGTSCSADFPAGTPVILTATAGVNSIFAGWDGGNCAGTGICNVIMNSAQSLTATFNPAGTNFPLTVADTGGGGGTVFSSPSGINCGLGGTNCVASFSNGTSVTLTATAGSGSQFSGWNGSCAGAGNCSLTMNAAQSIGANFTPAGGLTLTVADPGSGGTIYSYPSGISCGNGSASCSASFPMGTSVMLTATPAAGSMLAGWNVPGCGGTGSCYLTMNAAQYAAPSFRNMLEVTGSISYTGTLSFPVRLEFWTNNAFSDQLVALQMLSGPGPFDIMLPGSGSYFIRAFMDLNSDNIPNPNEPSGVYAPFNQGAEALVLPATGAVSGVALSVKDPGASVAGLAGEGSAALSVSMAAAGSIFNSTMTYVSLSTGIQTGGVIGVVMPSGFSMPQFVTAASTNGGVSFSIKTMWPSVLATITGDLKPGQQANLVLNGVYAPCLVSTQTFIVVSAQNAAVAPRPLFSGSPALAVVPGSAGSFQPATPYFSLMQGAWSDPQILEARDVCGNKVAVTGSPRTAVLRGMKKDPASTGFITDAAVGLATATTAVAVTSINLDFAVGQSSRSFFAVAASSGGKTIELDYDLGSPSTFYFGFNALPSGALTNVSVSTQASLLGQTSVTIAPNGDPSNPRQAFINFNLGAANTNWHVLISSSPLLAGVPAVPVWETWGSGQPGLGAVAWDGRYSPSINSGVRVPNGTYYIRLEIGFGLQNDSLSVQVITPQLSGTVSDAGSTPALPLANASLQAFGVSGAASAQSDVLGAYALPGLGAGVQKLVLSRDGYVNGNLSVTLNGSGVVSTFTVLSQGITASTNAAGGLDFLMSRAPVLVVIPTLVSYSTQPVDQWGGLQVLSSDPSQPPLSSPLRLPAGTTTFDDGGQWDPGLNSYVAKTRFKFNVGIGSYTAVASFADFAPSSAAVFVGASGAVLNLPAFSRKSSVSGLVTVSSNTGGLAISVNAVPLSSSTILAGGFAQVLLGPGILSSTYTIAGLDAGTYLLRANTNAFAAVSTGPIAIPASSDVAGVDFPTFSDGGRIFGTVQLPSGLFGMAVKLDINVWSPGSSNLGSTSAYKSPADWIASSTIDYLVKGLDSGATYQLYANVASTANISLEVVEGMPLPVHPSLAGVRRDFTFIQSSGVLLGTILLPAGSTDFIDVDLFRTVIASVRPSEVGQSETFSGAHTLPNFRCTANNQPAAGGYCPAGNSSATFTVPNLNTETMDVTMLYRRTGGMLRQSVSVVNGSTTTVLVDLTPPTFSISGVITDQITNPLFNTNPLLVANAPFLAPPGWPADLSSSTARVLAIRQDADQFNVAVSTVYDPANTRVGFLTQGGTFTITNVPAGVYFLRTESLRACATCDIAVPAAGATIRVAADVSNLNLVLSDGYSAAGTISLDGGIQDSVILLLTLRNHRQEVVRSTMVYLGDAAAGLVANSVDYGFANLPPGEFYTLSVQAAGAPAQYVAAPIKFPNPGLAPQGLAGNLTQQNVAMKRAAYIMGRLRDLNTGELITAFNAQLLAPSFRISATANPWVEGGYSEAPLSTATLNRPIGMDGYFRVGPLLPGAAYDLTLAQTSWDASALLQGSQNYAPVVMSGLSPQAGEIKDVGVVSLNQGQFITGLVRSTSTGAALGGLKVTAQPSFGLTMMNVETFTNGAGRYTLWVSTSVSSQFDLTAAPRDGNQATDGLRYGAMTARNVIVATAAVNFDLQPLLAMATGCVVVVDSATGGELSYPFGDKRGYPAAAINLQPVGVVPLNDPLGDIEAITDAAGCFAVPGLSTGSYSLAATSLGYMIGRATVTTNADGFRIYTGSDTPSHYLPGNTLVLTRGATVTGRIIKSDGSAPNNTEVGGVAAANFGQNELVMGSVDLDPVAKTVNSYSVSGFRTGVSYDVILLPKDAAGSINMPVEGKGVSFAVSEATSTKNINLTYLSSALDCLPASKKSLGNNQFQIKFECNPSLRKQLAADDDLDLLVAVSSFDSAGHPFTAPNGTGSMLTADKQLSSDRRLITVIYRAAAQEANFSLRIRAYSQDVNPRTGTNYYLDRVYNFYAGLDSNSTKKISNIQGGSVELEPTADDEALGFSERALVALTAGSFADDSGVVAASNTVEVGISKGKDEKLAKSLALRALGYVPAGLDVLQNLSAYPPEMGAAIAAFRGLGSTQTVGGVNPLSSFYNIFLPAGIRHQLKQRADLTLSYSTIGSSRAVANSDAINVWFYNATLGRYVKEDTNRRLDPFNKTITVSVDHFSTFVVLDGAPTVQAPGTIATTEILAFNFPNPSDCKVHSGIQGDSRLSWGAGPGGIIPDFKGTMIRYSLPPGPAAGASIQIYSLNGELVRKIDQGQVAGNGTYYFPWDCNNSGGRMVASGVYIGEVQWGDQRKFFKIAIIKGSGL